ncbi:MAG TPA: protein kinase, partial [Gammaproteobacteria bacterium]|nr:protein kinase [Gammaproteobacteria bacterium]
SDIYSLGVTFFEVASRKMPFQDAEDANLIPLWIAQGTREDIPEDCPPKVASLIKFCWDDNPDKRPAADEIVKYLKSEQDDFKKFTDSHPALSK